MPRYYFNPMMASSVNFPVEGEWYSLHPQLHKELSAGGLNNPQTVAKAKELGYSIGDKKKGEVLVIYDPKRPDLIPSDGDL